MNLRTIAFVTVLGVAPGLLWYIGGDIHGSPKTSPPTQDERALPLPLPLQPVLQPVAAAPSEKPAEAVPPDARRVVHLDRNQPKPDPAEEAQHLQRSVALIERTVGWLSERRAKALREAHTEDAHLLDIRLARLSDRLAKFQRGEDPDRVDGNETPEERSK